MYFYVGFAAIIFLMTAYGVRMVVALSVWAMAVMAANVALQSFHLASPIFMVITHPLTLEFIAGAAVGVCVRNKICLCALPALMGGIFMLVGVMCFVTDPQSLVDNHDTWLHILLLGVPCVLIVYGSTALERGMSVRSPDWLVALGNASYSTYLSHVLVLSALGRTFAFLPFHNLYVETLFVVACIIVANAVGLLSQRTIERPSQTWLRAKLLPKTS
jgi:peptidoglycan/LPS O-acetylase OafA/YrhL